MHCVGGCGAFIPQGQVGYFIGGSIHLPVCKKCTEKERGSPPVPPPPISPLYPGMFVGHLPDDKLLELLNYWPNEMHSELCGPDARGVLWQVRRYAGTLVFNTFAYPMSQDGTKYYTGNHDQGSIRYFSSMINGKALRRDQLRWFPWYSYDSYGVTGPEPLYVSEGMQTPWGEAHSVTPVIGGVCWVKANERGGFMLAVHRAAQLLSPSALAIGELFAYWLCYSEDRACAVVIHEHPEWCHIFTNPDLSGMVRSILERHYPQYLQAAGMRPGNGR
jgi:hypothetical protein